MELPRIVLLPLAGLVAMVGVMSLLYWAARHMGNAGIVDAGWALGVAGLAVGYAVAADGDAVRRMLLALMAFGWGSRLGLHIFFDRVLGKEEDGRYRTLKTAWGGEGRQMFRFFMLQAVFTIFFSLPFLPVAAWRAPISILSVSLALIIWATAITGESVADHQLARWRAQPENHGKTCRTGLWRYSRHPNYFFEWVHWWAYVVLGLTAPWGWLTLLGPAVMLLFLYRITGIPYTEAQSLKSRGDDYRRYQQTTSAFFPWFPRKSGG